jgi:hypothetical protein
MNNIDWRLRDDYGATLITGITGTVRRSGQIFIVKIMGLITGLPKNDARARGKAPDRKVIAKIRPDIPAN